MGVSFLIHATGRVEQPQPAITASHCKRLHYENRSCFSGIREGWRDSVVWQLYWTARESILCLHFKQNCALAHLHAASFTGGSGSQGHCGGVQVGKAEHVLPNFTKLSEEKICKLKRNALSFWNNNKTTILKKLRKTESCKTKRTAMEWKRQQKCWTEEVTVKGGKTYIPIFPFNKLSIISTSH